MKGNTYRWIQKYGEPAKLKTPTSTTPNGGKRKMPSYIIVDECSEVSEEQFNRLGAILDKAKK
jgi:hypothetical protein